MPKLKGKQKPDPRVAVLEELRKGAPLSPMQLARACGLTPRMASRALSDLAKISEALPGAGFCDCR